MPAIVTFEGVSKAYPVYDAPSQRLREILTLQRRSFHRDFWALRDVTFEAERGETLCVLGENGSGKSTLLQIVAGILTPTAGAVTVRGRVAALLELGAGFNPEFSGRDNVYMNAAILGLSTREIDRRFPSIAEFAEIGDFMSQPVKTYSSGMAMRLGFAVAIHVDPEVLLVDEALAVGDVCFRQRCLRKVEQLRKRGVTIFFVSHSIGDVKNVGDRALWLERGVVRDIGPVERVVNHYLAAMTEKDHRYRDEHGGAGGAKPDSGENELRALTSIPNIDHRHGDGRARIVGVAVLNSGGTAAAFLEPRSEIAVRVSVRAEAELALPVAGVVMRNHLGVEFCATNTTREGLTLAPLKAGDEVTLEFCFSLPELYPGNFSFSAGVGEGSLSGADVCDWIDNALTLQMISSGKPVYGYLYVPCEVTVNPGARQDAVAAVDSVS